MSMVWALAKPGAGCQVKSAWISAGLSLGIGVQGGARAPDFGQSAAAGA